MSIFFFNRLSFFPLYEARRLFVRKNYFHRYVLKMTHGTDEKAKKKKPLSSCTHDIIQAKVFTKIENIHNSRCSFLLLHRLTTIKFSTWTVPIRVTTLYRPDVKPTALCRLALVVEMSPTVDAFYLQLLMLRQSCSEFPRTRVQTTGREYRWSWHTRSSSMTLPPGKW